MDIEPVTGAPVRFPPGRVAVRLTEKQGFAYKRLYARYRTLLDDLPVLGERDFDGRILKITPKQLEALNRGFASLRSDEDGGGGAFDAQEQARNRLFKKLQFLS